jgi:2-iminobutanoate/2-iminopropanoate deaminase
MPHPIVISSPRVAPTNKTYNQAVRLGPAVYVSGQTGVNPATGELVAGGQVAEYRRALENVRLILEDAGLSMSRVVKTTIYMTDVSELVELNKIYAEYFPENAPAKTGVEVKGLAMGAQSEIEVIAAALD